MFHIKQWVRLTWWQLRHFHIKGWIRRRWWQFRHEVYYYEVPIRPSISPTGGDDTAMIQNAINEAAREPEWFTDIYAAYRRKWYRFLLKEPVLNASAKLQTGTYMIDKPITISDNVSVQGQGSEHTTIEKREGE